MACARTHLQTNTLDGRYDVHETNEANEILKGIHEDMQVVDADGKDIGKVEMVKFGDTEAATVAAGQQPSQDIVGGPGLYGRPNEPPPFAYPVAPATVAPYGYPYAGTGEPDVEEPLRSRMLREGFVKVDGPGLFSSDRYVRIDQIDGVTNGKVCLRARKAELVKES